MRTSIPLAAAVAALVLAAPTAADSGRVHATQLVGTVGPGFTIALEEAGGAAVTHLDPGAYSVLVHHDFHDFHLTGRSVNKRTGVAFKGSVRWIVTLRAGACRVSSDAHRSLAKTALVP